MLRTFALGVAAVLLTASGALAQTQSSKNIVDTAVAAGSFTTLAKALQAADLVDTLKGQGPFTVFAPTDEAFAAFLEAQGITAEDLLMDTEALTRVLLYHIVLGALPSEQVAVSESLYTLAGEQLAVSDIALSGTLDVEASNGIIHVIDGVLVPPSE
jgi:uncharacterized surface protein with fasciclin (FAS1) repeats